MSPIVKKNCHLLQSNEILKGLFPEYSILVAKKGEQLIKIYY